ncbi:DUF6461 domain-containing protein [Actinoplanes sp. NPDC049681]|uniref:DUF6461 domain-containing protein n=1 Tax=Actinoplanes sp. NPDC049681 TaxID=3363905 RepID=UPI003795B6FC
MLAKVPAKGKLRGRMGAMPPTAADYEWFTQSEDREIVENYCFTFMKGLSAEELVDRIGGTIEQELRGFEQIWEASMEAEAPVLAITSIGEWVMMVEWHTLIGGSKSTAVPLSANAVLISHFKSVDLDTSFSYIVDRDLQLSFSPTNPTMRNGSRVDDLTSAMDSAGFSLSDESEAAMAVYSEGAAFALAELLSGVHLSAELLDNSTFKYVLVPDA